MKYVIKESDLDVAIMRHIENIPELQNLEQFDCTSFDWDAGFDVEEICFQEDEDGYSVMSYYPYPENSKKIKNNDYKEELKYLPALKINDDDLVRTLNSLFDFIGKKPFEKWFEANYGLKVKTFYDF
jgi:hypothetical protein